MDQRIGQDGKPAEDVDVNPKAVERKAREAEERAQCSANLSEPWSRAKVERELARLTSEEPIYKFDDRDVRGVLNLHGADLSGLDLSGLNLSRVNLHGAKLVGTDLTGTTLAGANLNEADLSDAVLKGADLAEANLSGSCICDADASEASFKKANLSDACFEGAKGFDVQDKALTPAELQVAKYKQAEGFKVDVDLDKGVARYVGAQLEGANVTSLSAVHVEEEAKAEDAGAIEEKT